MSGQNRVGENEAMAEFTTRSVVETEDLAARLAQRVAAGWVIGLHGDLGAGKTAFARGFARGLGCPGRVHSPTYALLNEYPGGRLPLAHLDLYRLNSAEDVRSAGLEEYLVAPVGVTLVEWPERWTQTEPRSAGWRTVEFSTLGEASRRITCDWFP